MKICPECSFVNEERFPACLWCNTLLVRVRSTPAPDPNHPEHADRRRLHAHWSRQRWQRLFALGCYVVGIVFLAVVPGFIFSRELLGYFGVIAFILGFAMARGWLGQFSVMFLQGTASALLVLNYGTFHFLTSVMLLGHIALPATFAQWVELIDGGHA